ncbi:amidase [Cupriavidus sp. M-11]|uniref:amidase n=1 Tax=Cupriavidus sp. M-11 TaxID=3233038 RepID=UPI003F928079
MNFNHHISGQYSDDHSTSIKRSPTQSPRDDVGAFVPGKAVEWQPTGSGHLDGLTCGIKDVFDIAGCPTGYGNPQWEETHALPAADAFAVSKLRENGARIVGKTVTDELAFSLAGNNFHYGSPINTAAPDRLTGGSSCGSAAAVAAGLCDIGLGTDTAGSIRAPASFCGVFGIRTTHGVIPSDGVRALAPSFDAVGWLTRDARTLAAAGRALLPDAMRPEAFTGWMSFDGAWSVLPEATQRAAASVLSTWHPCLEDRRSLHTAIPELDEFVNAFRTVQFYEVWKELGPWVARAQPALGPDIAERIMLASKVTRDEYLAASVVRDRIRAQFHATLEQGQVIVMPTVSGPAPLRASTVAELNSQRLSDLRFLSIAPLVGLPQISLPLLTANGAPLGLSIIGAAGSDKSLLALVEKLEAQSLLTRPTRPT